MFDNWFSPKVNHCGDMPTISNQHISDDFITNTTTKQMISTLFHEQFHIYQRKYPMIFKKLYSQWNFKYINL